MPRPVWGRSRSKGEVFLCNFVHTNSCTQPRLEDESQELVYSSGYRPSTGPRQKRKKGGPLDRDAIFSFVSPVLRCPKSAMHPLDLNRHSLRLIVSRCSEGSLDTSSNTSQDCIRPLSNLSPVSPLSLTCNKTTEFNFTRVVARV